MVYVKLDIPKKQTTFESSVITTGYQSYENLLSTLAAYRER